MSRIAYVNGAYVPHRQGAVSIEDRGYQFSDGVYEVICLFKGKLIDAGPHLDRLDRSLAELSIPNPYSRAALMTIIHETIRRNRLSDGLVYLQMTRGTAPRDHQFPEDTRPALVVTARYFDFDQAAIKAAEGMKAITYPDIRWARRDIKSVSLLPNILAKQAAVEKGAYEAIMTMPNGLVTEGCSTNFWIVDQTGLRTHPVCPDILNGITRSRIIEIAKKEGVPLNESPFTVEEARQAREAFTSSSVRAVQPILTLDDHPIGSGLVGPITTKIFQSYQRFLKTGVVS
jgi:D-alanine transaminase